MDAMFSGIFPRSRLSVLTGHAQDDVKSVFAMHALVEFLVAHPKCAAIWIDTLGVFQGFLFRDILRLYFSRQSLDNNEAGFDERLAKASERVQLIRVFDATGLQESLYELENSFANTTSQAANVDDTDQETSGFLVIDSISATYSRAMAHDQSMGHAYMETFLKTLGKFSRTYNITSILINSSVTATSADVVRSQFDSVAQKPSLGSTFLYLVDFCTLISRDPRSGVYVLEILADRWRATEGHLLYFELVVGAEFLILMARDRLLIVAFRTISS
ncbi:hypothetical protein V1525DRAFT_369194 [Lipomyces kononenkoae]|uniref:Uncharacterized protein n=1 Tax=Lipomyces kononenkoae TaxID=34357 RepID=A0ACC3TCG9_LIPKO